MMRVKFESKWHRIAWEFRQHPATMSDAYRHLCEFIVRADIENTDKIKKVYPELVHYLLEVDL